MEEIVIKKQHQLSFSETLDFCNSSIMHRFSRSLLTLSVVILAVAFFMFLQCSNIFRNSVKSGVEQEILNSRKPSRILNMLYVPLHEQDFIKMLVNSKKNKDDLARIENVLGLNEKQMGELLDSAYQEFEYQTFFDGLTIGKRKDLFTDRSGAKDETKEGRQMFKYLTEPGKLDHFKEQLKEMGGIRIPGGEPRFEQFIKNYDKYNAVLLASLKKWTDLQQSIAVKGWHLDDAAVLRTYFVKELSKEGALNAWRENLKSKGFVLTESDVQAINQYQIISDKMAKMQTMLSDAQYRMLWRRVYGQSQYGKMDEKLQVLSKGKTERVFKDTTTYLDGSPFKMTDLKEITQEFLKRQELRNLELELDINLLKSDEGFSSSQLYLMCLSFLVCVVGITNAMLMSITERFREIATLKCLGATDSFILVQIVLEAAIQGVIGGIAGLLLGFIVALVSSVGLVGFRVFATIDWSQLGMAALYSLVAGILLSVLSSLYPSMKASRMAPMEAMRVE